MADYVKKIRTSKGDLQIDYNALANLPAIPSVDDVGQLLTDVDQLQEDSIAFYAHISDRNNPHEVEAKQVSINDELAGNLDLMTPAFAEDAFNSLLGEVNNIYSIIDGGVSKYRWKTYQWDTYNSTVDINSSSYFYSTNEPSFNLQVADSFEQDPSTGKLSLVNPTTITETKILPDVGKYFIAQSVGTDGNDQESIGEWTADCIYQVTSNSYTENRSGRVIIEPEIIIYHLYFRRLKQISPYEKYIGFVSDDDASKYPEDGWIDNIHYIKDEQPYTSVAKIERGSYIGNGNYGSSGSTDIPIVSFIPRIVIIDGVEEIDEEITTYDDYDDEDTKLTKTYTHVHGYRLMYIFGSGYSKIDGYGVNYHYVEETNESYVLINPFVISRSNCVKTTWSSSKKTLSLKSEDDAEHQFNISGVTYRYIAIS